MGTRGFVGFVVDGVEKIAYNQFDSYPEGLGEQVLAWASVENMAEAKEQARALRVVSADSKPSAEDIERLRQWADLNVGEQSLDDWYSLLRKTQGEPAHILEAGVIQDSSLFPLDSLFAEWGYVVDFDAGTFEVYEGFQRSAHDRGRFASRGEPGEYYPCALVRTWRLDELPNKEEFAAAFAEPDDAEDN